MQRKYSILVLIALLYSGSNAALVAQRRAVLDTVYRLSPGLSCHSLQAYNDTVYFTAYDTDSPTESSKVFGSSNAGDSWTVLLERNMRTVSQRTNRAQQMGIGYLSDGSGLNMWVLRGFDLVLDTIFRRPTPNASLVISKYLFHPFDANTIIAESDHSFHIYDWIDAAISTDLGRTWRQISPPFRGAPSAPDVVQYCYNRNDTVGLTFRCYDSYGMYPYEFFTTNDSGRTYHRTPRINGPLWNYFAEGTFLQTTYSATYGHEPVLKDSAERPVDSLYWFANAAATLPYDSARYSFHQSFGIHFTLQDPNSFVYAPENRGVFAGRFYMIEHGQPYGSAVLSAVAATFDSAATWQWVVEPSSYHDIPKIALDPITETIYVSLAQRDTLTNKNLYTVVRYRTSSPLHVESVADAVFHVYPQPASDVITVMMPERLITLSSVLVDNLGRSYDVVQTSIDVTDTSTRITYNVDGVPSGIYTLVITTHDATLQQRVVITQ